MAMVLRVQTGCGIGSKASVSHQRSAGDPRGSNDANASTASYGVDMSKTRGKS